MAKSKSKREPYVVIPLALIDTLIKLPTVAALRTWLLLEAENQRHQGRRNGRLIVTQRQMVAAGAGKFDAVVNAIRALEAAGIIETTRGAWRPGVGRRPSQYLLRHQPVKSDNGRAQNPAPEKGSRPAPEKGSNGMEFAPEKGSRFPAPEKGSTAYQCTGVQGEGGETVAGGAAAAGAARARRRRRAPRLGSSPLRNGAANGAAATAVAKLAWHAPVARELSPDKAAEVRVTIVKPRENCA